MLRGIWVTTVDWAGDSLREGRLLPCQGYEVQVRTCLAPPSSVSSATLPPEQSHPSSGAGVAPPFALVRRCQILLAIGVRLLAAHHRIRGPGRRRGPMSEQVAGRREAPPRPPPPRATHPPPRASVQELEGQLPGVRQGGPAKARARFAAGKPRLLEGVSQGIYLADNFTDGGVVKLSSIPQLHCQYHLLRAGADWARTDLLCLHVCIKSHS